MSIYVKTSNPASFLQNIKDKIEKKDIPTWAVDDDGDFTHSPGQWAYHAWMRPFIETGNNRIVFGIICRKDSNLSVEDYAVYHGRFVEMLLTHFDKECDSIEVTPLATGYDKITANIKA